MVLFTLLPYFGSIQLFLCQLGGFHLGGKYDGLILGRLVNDIYDSRSWPFLGTSAFTSDSLLQPIKYKETADRK